MDKPLPCLALLILLLLPAEPARAALAVPDGHVGLEVGACRLVLPVRNAGASGDLAATCREDVPRIFRQLGSRIGDGPGDRIEVRLVDDPARLAGAAPPDAPPPRWAGAVAYPEQDLVILALRHRDGSPVEDLRAVLAHELSHLALRRALPPGAAVPRWLSEGIAIQQSEGSSLLRAGLLRGAGAGGSLLPLSALERYPETAGAVGLAYAEAAGFVGYLLADGGWTGIRALLDRLRRGEGLEEGFAAVYGRTLAEAEGDWRASLSGGLGFVALVTGTGALWGGITVLFIVAVGAARRRKRRRLEAMAAEEAPVQRLIAAFEQVRETLPDAPRIAPPPGPLPRTKVVVDGRIHTLH